MRWIVFLAALAACTAAWAQEPAHPDDPEPAAQPPASQAVAPGGRVLTVTWRGPRELCVLLEKYLPPPTPESGERRAGSLRPWIRDIRRRVPEIAASEGYFSTTLDIELDTEARDHATVTVTPGPRTEVDTVDISFKGDIAGDDPRRGERRSELTQSWALKRGQAFRSPDWELAKTHLEEAATESDYAAASLVETRAEVDVESAKAHLKIVVDSGPAFTLGDVEIVGIDRYPEAVVRRLVDLERGERYNRTRLQEMQHLVQSGPWFSSVVVDVERDPMKSNLAPVKVSLTERPAREVGLSLGYGTDDGLRGEAAYRDRDLFHRGFDLQSSVRVAQERQIGYADIYLPPGLVRLGKLGAVPFKDSVGFLTEHSTIENLALSRFAVAGYRHFFLESFELRVGLSYQVERSYPEGSDVAIKRALAPIVAVTWRRVDNMFDPKRGGVFNVQFATGSRSLASGEDFFKAYAQFQYWIPLGAMDQLLLRTEVGRTFAASRENLPEDFLFRAGGARSNRGYAYQSLGVQEGNAIVGGRFLATGALEYVHWLNDRWGAALFTDVGGAADSPREWQALKSYGIGARYKTPAGPFALDLAYAGRDHKFRLAFSVTIAF